LAARTEAPRNEQEAAMSAVLKPSLDLDYTLEHKYTRLEGRIYLSGVQALVRLPLMQQMRDRAAGINTGGFISGYRGSPLGGFDLELWKAKKHLKASNIEFQPGLNEDLGATMVWGTQQTNLFPARSTMACSRCGTARAPAWTAAATCSSTATRPARRSTAACWRSRADDHACRSSTLPHGSELEFVSGDDAGAEPGRRAGHSRHGQLGWAMSRFTGRWVGFKTDRRDGRSSPRERATRTSSTSCATDFRAAAGRASTSAGPIRRSTRRCACTVRDARRGRVRRAPTASTRW
jgi:indolepyruvate ferredoxin oxidoreductase